MTVRRRPAAPDTAHDDLRSAVRESATLPAIFLTVMVAGGFRAAASGGQFSFVPPPLVHLVLAVLMVSVLVRSGVLAPERLMHAGRSPLANLSGGVVLATLFGASAQLLNAMTPEAGLFHLFFVVLFALLFWNTLAVGPNPGQALRSLLLVLGTALVAKHVVLASLFAPQPSLTKRVLTALLSGVSLGGLHHEPAAAVTGYVAFGAVALYFAGLVLLPRRLPGATRGTALVVSTPGEDAVELPGQPPE